MRVDTVVIAGARVPVNRPLEICRDAFAGFVAQGEIILAAPIIVFRRALVPLIGLLLIGGNVLPIVHPKGDVVLGNGIAALGGAQIFGGRLGAIGGSTGPTVAVHPADIIDAAGVPLRGSLGIPLHGNRIILGGAVPFLMARANDEFRSRISAIGGGLLPFDGFLKLPHVAHAFGGEHVAHDELCPHAARFAQRHQLGQGLEVKFLCLAALAMRAFAIPKHVRHFNKAKRAAITDGLLIEL